MRDYLKSLASDLLTLEINTIVKENFTASKMPSTFRVALLNIADNYRNTLVEYGICRTRTDGELFSAQDKQLPLLRWRFGGEYSFGEINYYAKQGQQILEKRKEQAVTYRALQNLEQHSKMLFRIQRHSANIFGMFKNRRKDFEVGPYDMKPLEDAYAENGLFISHTESAEWNNDVSIQDINRLEDIQLEPHEITLIRKTWEIGTQTILLQTVIQIDGDIANYLTPTFIELPHEMRSIVLNMHSQSTESGTRVWQMLFATISQLAGKAFQRIFDGKSSKKT
jgi:hypothetical protein